MASSTTLRLRKLWFQLHKWLGLLLAAAIVPIALTGSALVWHDALDAALNPERATEARPALPPGAYAAAASAHLAPGERIASIALPREGGPVVVTAARPPVPGGGRPARTLLYLDPADGRLLDRAASNQGLVHIFHVLHGSLMVPGVGRQIVGWIGVAMLASALTGLWLWWPLAGRWSRGLRWRRQGSTSANLHHQAGFWIALPLAMLSFTGIWISFPAPFASLSGDPPPPSAAERARRSAAQPLAAPALTPDRALAAARPLAGGAVATIAWPTGPSPEWKLSFAGTGAPTEIAIDDRTGAARPPRPPQPESKARLMRRLHDGTGMGWLWQAVIFAGGILPALLAVTGVLMWLRSRRWRTRAPARRPAAAPAE